MAAEDLVMQGTKPSATMLFVSIALPQNASFSTRRVNIWSVTSLQKFNFLSCTPLIKVNTDCHCEDNEGSNSGGLAFGSLRIFALNWNYMRNILLSMNSCPVNCYDFSCASWLHSCYCMWFFSNALGQNYIPLSLQWFNVEWQIAGEMVPLPVLCGLQVLASLGECLLVGVSDCCAQRHLLGTHIVTSFFPLITQIRWKIWFVLILIPVEWSLQYFAHATTAVLSWHVQNFV